MEFRRIVTGHDASGKSVIRADEKVAPVTFPTAPGFESYELWSEKGQRYVQATSGAPNLPRYFPDEDEIMVRFCVFPPEEQAVQPVAMDVAEAAADVERRYPGMLSHFSPDDPAMHRTDSVDFGFVVSGEVELELDGGQTVKLKPGSCVVQTGTWHAWRNRSGKPATMAFVLAGAKRRAPK